MLIGIFKIVLIKSYLPSCILIKTSYFTCFECHPVSPRLSTRTRKILMRLSILFFFLRLSASKCSYYVLIFHQKCLIVNHDNYSWWLWLSLISISRARAGRFSACSTHLLLTYWGSMIYVVCMCHLVLLYVRIKIIEEICSFFTNFIIQFY